MSKSGVSKSARLVVGVFVLGLTYSAGQLFGQVDVSQDSPGVAYAGTGCKLTFTQGSNSVSNSSCSTAWTSMQVGTILTYTGGSAPNFRAVVTGVSGSGSPLTLGAIFPASSVTNTTSFTSTGNDACARIQASLLNNTGDIIDARALTGSQNCTVNPMAGTDINNGPGGQLWLGATTYNTTRTWTIPPAFLLIGLGKNNGGSGGTNTYIIAYNPGTSPKWTDMYAANGGTSTAVSTGAGAATFTDTNAVFNSLISSAACDTGAFGHLVLTTALTGLVEGDEITIQNVNSSPTNQPWNGNWPVIAVSGTSVEVEFQNTCGTPTVSGSSTADIVTNNVVQAEWTPSIAGTTIGTMSATTPGGGTGFVATENTGTDFSTNDVGSCTVTGTTSGMSPVTTTYTISALDGTSPTSSVWISVGSNPGWTTGTGSTTFNNKTCWVQGHIASTTPETPTVLNTAIGMQNSVSNTSVQYSIGRPVVAVAPFGGNHSSEGIAIQDVTFNGNNIAATVIMTTGGMQENSYIINTGNSDWTAYGIDAEEEMAHAGIITTMQFGASNSAPPTAACIMYQGSGAPAPLGWEFRDLTCTANSNGSDPFVAIEASGPMVSFQGVHCERFVNCFRVGQYNDARGVTAININPGVAEWDGFLIDPPTDTLSQKVDFTILGAQATNAAQNAMVEDDTSASGCGAGTTYLTDITGTVTPSISLYSIGSSASSNTGRTRITTDPMVTTCLGNTTSTTRTGGVVAASIGLMSSRGHINQAAASGDLAGTVTLSSGSGSKSFTGTWTSAPVCTCTDTTSAAAVQCSTTAATLSVAGTGSHVIAYHCVGNPN